MKGHTHRSKVFKFKNRGEMLRFILLYRDLFVPYSEDYKRYKSYVQEGPTWHTASGGLMSRGHHDENIIKMLEGGYEIIDNETLKINIEKNDLEEILKYGNYKKEKVMTGRYMYRCL